MKWFMIGAVCILAGCSLFTVDRPRSHWIMERPVSRTRTPKRSLLLRRFISSICVRAQAAGNTCAALGKAQDRLRLAETYVRDMLRDPKQPVDWAKINQFLQEALGIAIKLGAKAL